MSNRKCDSSLDKSFTVEGVSILMKYFASRLWKELKVVAVRFLEEHSIGEQQE
jgi:hypothetical protein